MAFRLCTDISEETRWLLDMQRDNPLIQDFIRANQIAVLYQDKHELNKRSIDALLQRNSDLVKGLETVVKAFDLHQEVELAHAVDRASELVKKAGKL